MEQSLIDLNTPCTRIPVDENGCITVNRDYIIWLERYHEKRRSWDHILYRHLPWLKYKDRLLYRTSFYQGKWVIRIKDKEEGTHYHSFFTALYNLYK